MERLSFIIASAAVCLFLIVSLTSAMSTECLCDGLAGSQCGYCTDVGSAYSDVEVSGDGYTDAYLHAWEQEHLEYHHEWVRAHEAFHGEDHADEEHREFHRSMDGDHRIFHTVVREQGITE